MKQATSKPRKNAKKTKGAGEKSSAPSVSSCSKLLRTEDIPVGAISSNPWQPRDLFEEAELKSLGETMKAVGQLQPIVVRPSADGYELLAGERRLRAAELVGMETIAATIRDASDADARKIAIIENDNRVSLSAIERARAYRLMLDNGDADGPTELAEQLKVPQSTLSNRLRLLELPESWQRRLISREIGERHARAVLAFREFPALLDALDEAMTAEIEELGVAPGVAEWENEIIPETIRQTGRHVRGPLNNGTVYDPHYGTVTVFQPTPDQIDELAIVEVGDEVIATNAELWDRLQAEHVEKFVAEKRKSEDEQEEAEATEEGEAVASGQQPVDSDEASEDEGDSSEAGNKPSAGEEPRLDEDHKPHSDFASRLWAWKVMFARRVVAEHLRTRASSAELLKVALLLMVHWDSYPDGANDSDLSEALKRHAGAKRVKNVMASTLAAQDFDIDRVAGAVLSLGFWSDRGPNDAINGEDVLMLAEFLGVDLAQEWAAGNVPQAAGYWNLHTKEQLLAIAKEVKLVDFLTPIGHADSDPKKVLEKCSKGDLVATFVRAMAEPDAKEAGIPMPKEIAKAKPPRK